MRKIIISAIVGAILLVASVPTYADPPVSTYIGEILSLLKNPTIGLGEIKREVRDILGNVTSPTFGLQEIKNEVNDIQDKVNDPNFGLKEIKRQVNDTRNEVLDPMHGLGEIKDEVKQILESPDTEFYIADFPDLPNLQGGVIPPSDAVMIYSSNQPSLDSCPDTPDSACVFTVESVFFGQKGTGTMARFVCIDGTNPGECHAMFFRNQALLGVNLLPLPILFSSANALFEGSIGSVVATRHVAVTTEPCPLGCTLPSAFGYGGSVRFIGEKPTDMNIFVAFNPVDSPPIPSGNDARCFDVKNGIEVTCAQHVKDAFFDLVDDLSDPLESLTPPF